MSQKPDNYLSRYILLFLDIWIKHQAYHHFDYDMLIIFKIQTITEHKFIFAYFCPNYSNSGLNSQASEETYILEEIENAKY